MPKKSAAERLKQRAQITPRLVPRSSTIQQQVTKVTKVTQLRMEDAQEFRRRENDRLGNLTALRKGITDKRLSLFDTDLSDQGKLVKILVQALIAQNFSNENLRELVGMAIREKLSTQTAASALIAQIVDKLAEASEMWQDIEDEVRSLPTYAEATTLEDVARIDDEEWKNVQTFLRPKPYAPTSDLKKSMVTEEVQPLTFERRYNFPTYLIASQPSKRLVASILRDDGKTNDLYAQVEANVLTPAFVIVRGDLKLEEVDTKKVNQPGRKAIISADDMLFEVLNENHQTEVDKRQLQIEVQEERIRRDMFQSNNYESFQEMMDAAPTELLVWLSNNQLFVDVLKLLDTAGSFQPAATRKGELKQLADAEEAKYQQRMEEISRREEKARQDIDVMRTGFAESKAMSKAAVNKLYTTRIADMEKTYRKQREQLASQHKENMERFNEVIEPFPTDAAHFLTEMDMQLSSFSQEMISKKCSNFCRPLNEEEWKLLSSDKSDLKARNALLADLMNAQDIQNVGNVFTYVRECIRNHCTEDIPIDVCLLRVIKQFKQTLPLYTTMQFSFPGYMRSMSLYERFGPIDAVIEWKTQEASYRSSGVLVRRVAEKNVLEPTSFVSSVQFTLIKNRPTEEVQNFETNLNTLMSSSSQDDRERIIRCILESPNPLSLVKKVLALEYYVDHVDPKESHLSTADFCSTVGSLYKALGLSENGDFKKRVDGTIRPTMMMEDVETLVKVKYLIDHNKYFSELVNEQTEEVQKVMDTSVDYLRDDPRGEYTPEEEQKIRDMESEFGRWMKLNYLMSHRTPRDDWIRQKYSDSGNIPPSFDQVFQVWMTMRYLDTHRDVLSRCFKNVPANVFAPESKMDRVHELFLSELEKIDLRSDCPEFVEQNDMQQLWDAYYTSMDDEKPAYDESLTLMEKDFVSHSPLFGGEDHFIVSVWKRCLLYPQYLITLLQKVCPDVETSVELFTQQEMHHLAESILREMDAENLFNAWTKYRPYHFSRYLHQHLPHLFGNPTRMFIKRLTHQKNIPMVPGGVWRALSMCNQRFTRYEEFVDCVSTYPGMSEKIQDAFRAMDVPTESRNKLEDHLTTMIGRSITFLPTSVFENIKERVGKECMFASTYDQFLDCLEKVEPNLPQVVKSLLLDAEMTFELERLLESNTAVVATAPVTEELPRRANGMFEDVLTELRGDLKPNDPELLEVYGIESSTGLIHRRPDWNDSRKSLLDVVRQSLRVRNGDMVIESLGKSVKSGKSGNGSKSDKSGKGGKSELTIVVDEDDDLQIDPDLADRARDWAVRQNKIAENELGTDVGASMQSFGKKKDKKKRSKFSTPVRKFIDKVERIVYNK